MPSKSSSLTLVLAHTENVSLSVSIIRPTNDSRLDVECLANFFSTLYSFSNCLTTSSIDYLKYITTSVQQRRATSYFLFPGNSESCLVLSPITRWPQKSGWSFSCWCFIEADVEGSNLLYSFLNKDGLGFTAHVEKNVLILTIIRLQGKGIQYRVPADILCGKWCMLTVVYVYNRWGSEEIQCFLDGSRISLLDASWHFGSELLLNRCSIGGSLGTSTRGTSFCGLLTNLMGFTIALSPEQIDAIYTLGVEYQGQFCFETECERDLSDSHRRLLYGGGHLRNSLMFAYIPSACDRNLCLNRAPKCLDVFAHSSHAIMNGEVKSVHRTSVTGALHCLGGIQVLYPLFERLDCPISTTDIEGSQGVCPSAALVPMVCTTDSASHDEESIAVILLDLLFTLARSSPPMGRQLVQTRGLLLLASALRSASAKNLNLLLLSRFIEVARELVSVADLAKSGTFNPGVRMHSSFVFTMLRHLHGYVFCNPDLWIRAPIEVQDQLYQFLAAEFLPNVVRHGCVNRTTTVLQSIYTLKYYYSLTDPRSRSGFQLRTTDHLPLSNPQDVLKLRANLLIYIRQLIIRLGVCLDAEMQALFSYFMTVQEDENLHDVLYLFVTLVVAHPDTIGPVFMRNNGLHVAFKLLTSNDEHNRIYAIKLIGFHLQQSKLSKRNDLMERYHLFTMLADRLSQFSESISMLTYNALFEVLVDQLTTRPQLDPLAQIPPDMVIKNPRFTIKIAERNRFDALFSPSWTSVPNGHSVTSGTLVRISPRAALSDTELDLTEPVARRLIGKLTSRMDPDSQNLQPSGVVLKNDDAAHDNCTDVLVGACGGLLPLLAAATTASGDVGLFESIEGLSMSDAMTFVLRIAFLVDLCTNHLDLGSIEKDRNMASGVLVRQFTRLYLMAAVRNCLESRFFHLQPSHEVLLQLKSFTNSADGVRFVPIISDMCAIQSADEVNSPCSAQDEADITTHQDHYNGFHYPSLIRGLVDPASEVELESLATRLFCLTKLLSTSAGPLESRLGFAPSPWRFMNFLSTDHLLLLNNLKQRHITRLGHLPRELHRLIFSLRPTLHYPVVHDLQRVPEFLAMSVAYFICVLMVSKYRDVLEPTLKLLTTPDSSQVVNAQFVKSPALARFGEPVTQPHSSSENLEAEHQIERPPSDVQTASSLTDSDEDDSTDEGSVADPPITVPLEKVEITTLPQRSHRVNDNRITEELNATLSSTASFLRDLFQDFSSHFSKNLVGSQGQALLTSGLATLRDSQSVVELVMLLCSQEWQSSLQKNAGLAFIELINEGRVLSRVIREHVLSVTAEAVALLDRLARADIKSHAEFDQITARLAANKREDARMCEHVITSARLHDQLSTLWLTNKMHRLMTHLWSNWSARLNRGSKTNNSEITEFYRLDNWEDDSRRRRRLSPNPHGSTHPYAVLNDRTEKTANRPTVPQLSIETVLKQTGAASGYGEESTDDSDSGVIDLVDGQVDTPQTSNSQLSSAQRRRASFDSVDLSIQLEGLMDSMDVGLTADVSFGIGVRGVLSVGRSELQFERDLSHSGTQPLDKKVLVYVESACNKWSFSEIHAVFTRRYLHRTVALELFVTSRSSIFLAFENTETLRRIVSALPPVGIGSKYGLARSRATTLASPRQLFTQSNMTQRWQRREISNFDYLMYLNTISGRTYNDLNQYPIFPWIIANYTSEELELNEPSNYRDLSKPIGALDPNRKAYFDERYASWEDDSQPPFHYGTHYSTAAFVLSYLLRLEPFTTLFLHLQDGKFDHPDRLFSSIGRTWDNCQRNTSDVKELIPEFFYLPEMFENSNHFNLGVTEDGEEVGEVKLPKWAMTPEQFVRIHRQLTDPLLVQAVQDQIQSFGQTPSQLLRSPHPHRNSALHLDPLVFTPLAEEVCMIYKFYSNAPVVFVASQTDNITGLSHPAVITVTANRTVVLTRWNNAAAARVHPIRAQNSSVTSSAMHGTDQSSAHPNVSTTTDKNDLSAELHLPGEGCNTIGQPSSEPASHKSNNTIAAQNCASLQSNYLLTSDLISFSASVSASPLVSLVGHEAEITSVAVSAELGLILSGSAGGTCLLHSTRGELLRQIHRFPLTGNLTTPDSFSQTTVSRLPVRFLSYHREGYLVVQYGPTNLTVYTLNGKQIQSSDLIQLAAASKYQITGVIFSACGHYLLISGNDGVVWVLRSHDLSPVHAFPRCDASVRSLRLTRDQRFLIVGLSSGSLVIFYVDFGQWHHEFQERYTY
ncbi:uncharacterized protein DEA37_0003748 [Paragonimus westermani]|uniref:Neurobeachin n=2 Tax=Paragonimus westermani TaxID=34504 RepID=A0A5J4NV39_9TREM|nr:uncharacterized protein DEA37_0003748 [Paragonimus westermani]